MGINISTNILRFKEVNQARSFHVKMDDMLGTKTGRNPVGELAQELVQELGRPVTATAGKVMFLRRGQPVRLLGHKRSE